LTHLGVDIDTAQRNPVVDVRSIRQLDALVSTGKLARRNRG